MAGTQYWGTGRLSTHKSVAFTGTAGSVSSVSAQTYKVRVVVTSAAYVSVGAAPVAVSTDAYVPADSPEYFTITPGQKVSAVQVSAGGTLHVTEIT